MGIEAVHRNFKLCDGDIGTMVGNAFNIRQYIGEHKSLLNCTLIVLQTCDMTRFCFENKCIDNLLKRFNMLCGGNIIVLKSGCCKLDNFAKCGVYDIKLTHCIG